MTKLILLRIVVLSIFAVITNQQINNGYMEIQMDKRKFNTKISRIDLNNSVNFARDTLNRLHRLEKNLKWSDVKIRHGTMDHANFVQNRPDQKALEQGKYAYVRSQATNHLKHKHCRRLELTEEDCLRFLSVHKLHETKLFPSCLEKSKVCPESSFSAKYRTMDGSCNHPRDAIKGESRTSYKRLLNADYLDGVEKIRNSVMRSKLPSARSISSKLFHNEGYGNYTLILMVWSDFVLHDLSHTVSRQMVHSQEKITCCREDGSNLSPRHQHPFCLPIQVPEDDQIFDQYGIRCISYVRSLPSITNECSFGSLEQLNQATHYLDGSQIYGSNSETSNELRTFENGLLHYQIINNNVFLPYSTNKEICPKSNENCFEGGDPRLNSNPLLTTLHTIFLREHNRIAKILGTLNPHWDDNRLFEESRRIVIAELQHITYNEFLPIILGEKYRKIIQNHLTDDFRPSIDSRVSNSFATAAMRFSKLFIKDLKVYDENRNVTQILNVKDVYFRPSVIENNLDGFLIGLSTGKIENNKFRHDHYELDVVSLDIQRGRDHGLQSYTNYRKLCRLGEVEDFKDLSPIIPEKMVNILQQLYKDPNDIDLLVGGLLEKKLNDGVVGPTFSCILTDQFLRTKHGDRYFYTHIKQPKPFTNQQLRQIQKTTLGMIFCLNGNLTSLQSDVFRTVNERNYLRDCSVFPKINLEFWRETI